MESGKECLIAKDLREDDFVMFDKTKGMDLDHAKFVMEELGRFHACSLLYEKQQNKDIDEIYPEFIVRSWKSLIQPYSIYNISFKSELVHDVDSPSIKAMSEIVQKQGEMTFKILSVIQNIDPSVEWWTNLSKYSGNILNRHSDPDMKFNLLCHGDNWTNNMLFK